MWCGTLSHLSFTNLSNFLEIRANLDCLGIIRNSTMYLDFARRTQRYVPRRHPRSRKIPNFNRNYHFTLFQKIRIFRGFTCKFLLKCLYVMNENVTHPFPHLEPSLTLSRMPKPSVRKHYFQNKRFLFLKT